MWICCCTFESFGFLAGLHWLSLSLSFLFSPALYFSFFLSSGVLRHSDPLPVPSSLQSRVCVNVKVNGFCFCSLFAAQRPPPPFPSFLSFFSPIQQTQFHWLSLSLFFCDSEKLRQFLWAYMSMCPKMCTYTWSSNEKIWKCLHKSGVWHAMQPVKPIAEFCLSLTPVSFTPLNSSVSSLLFFSLYLPPMAESGRATGSKMCKHQNVGQPSVLSYRLETAVCLWAIFSTEAIAEKRCREKLCCLWTPSALKLLNFILLSPP